MRFDNMREMQLCESYEPPCTVNAGVYWSNAYEQNQVDIDVITAALYLYSFIGVFVNVMLPNT